MPRRPQYGMVRPWNLPVDDQNSTLETALFNLQNALLRLPQEIWDMVETFGFERLVFAMRVAWQIEGLKYITPINRTQRFDTETLSLKSDYLRIHVIRLGGRRYISSLSDPRESDPQENSHMRSIRSQFELSTHDYDLNGSTYLAIKSDDIGVIEIAIRRIESGPDRLLRNKRTLMTTQISEARDVNLRELRFITDVREFATYLLEH